MNKSMTMTDTAAAFFDIIETGKGWAACAPFCTPGATFSCQSDALAEIGTIEAYAGWVEGLLKLAPDGNYEMKAFAADEGRATVLGFAVFHGTHTDEGGPVPPTGRSVAADYVYAMTFDGPKITHMTKIWNVTARLSPPARRRRDGLRHVHSDVASDVSYARRGDAGRGSGCRATSPMER